MTHPSGIGKATRDLREMGPWAPILVLLIFYLIMGLDISLGGAQDDPRHGYVSLSLFAVLAVAAVRWRRQPLAMAMVCLVLIVLQAGLAAMALISSAVDFGLPFIAIAGIVFGTLGMSAVLFWRRSSKVFPE